MSTGKRKDEKDLPPPEGPVAAKEDLLTSEELFGELLDPAEARPLGTSTAPPPLGAPTSRKAPIKVQVADPRAPKQEEKPAPAEPLPDDVAALLDIFGGPDPPASAASPPPSPEPSASPEDIARPTSRTGTKFQAVAPAAAAPASGGGLDLAALADAALQGVPAEAGPPSSTPSAGVAVPTRGVPFGPYNLLQKIAVGGMAEVFKAKRSGVEGFEKVVAVKRILPHLSDNKEFVDMFIDEAKMVAGLAHPNIVQIFDLGKIEKSYYIAMEYVHGRDLRSILRRAKERGFRVPLDLAVLVVGKVASALEYAHRKKDDRGRAMKIVHRDISPQNILISFEGEVKLTDFGIAKAATKARTTDSGTLRGKLLYMSPEQASGKAVDRRSDMYSLGLVFYEMITDQRAFQATSEASILELVRDGRVVRPTTLNPKLPERIERAVMKALAKDPSERHQDGAEMYRELERFVHERQQPLAPTALARFLELLFDEGERADVRPEDGSPDTRPATPLPRPAARPDSK